MTGSPSAWLGERTWPEAAGRPLLVLPVGSCEQHGPHLPLDTDTRIAAALAEALVDRLPSGTAVVAPAVSIGASGEHAGFAGTLSVGTEVLTAMLVELVRSADWASGVVMVNGHGGNADAVGTALRRCTAEGRRVLAWWPRVAGGDAHAGRTETSLMLALAPHLVRVDLAAPGVVAPVAELMPRLRQDGLRGVSPNGVLGDPTDANAPEGRAVFERLVAELVDAVLTWTS